jgi:integrase/recombinase XerD
MVHSLIPFPSTYHPNLPFFTAVDGVQSRSYGWRPVLGRGGCPTYEVHPEASAYLHYLLGSARPTNTIRAYTQRLAALFTWLDPARLNWTDGVPVVSGFIRELAVTALPDPAGNADAKYRHNGDVSP